MKDQSEQKFFTLSYGSVLTVIGVVLVAVLIWLGVIVYKAHQIELSIQRSQLSQLEDCTPFNVYADYQKENEAISLSWQTKEKCLGYVEAGNYISNTPYEFFPLELVSAKEHSIELPAEDDKTYYIVIISGGVAYGDAGSPLVVTTIK